MSNLLHDLFSLSFLSTFVVYTFMVYVLQHIALHVQKGPLLSHHIAIWHYKHELLAYSILPESWATEGHLINRKRCKKVENLQESLDMCLICAICCTSWYK